MSPFLSRHEVEAMCDGLAQPAAIYRYIRDEYRIPIRGKMPCGLPLIARSDIEQAKPNTQPAPNRSGFLAMVQKRKAA